jgi:ligand-binding SRPBCC domain-containing protein
MTVGGDSWHGRPVALLRFESELSATPERVWEWMTSVRGVQTELWPIMKMTAPRSMTTMMDVPVELGKPLFRSWVFLFGVLPIDRSDLTLISLDTGSGFVEESPMLSMKLWRHERRISTRDGKTVLTDTLTFEPRFAARLSVWLIQTTFEHRHRVLRERLGGGL